MTKRSAALADEMCKTTAREPARSKMEMIPCRDPDNVHACRMALHCLIGSGDLAWRGSGAIRGSGKRHAIFSLRSMAGSPKGLIRAI
jgi:hypothetical protein